METSHMKIEQDGPRYRWAWYIGGVRAAKGTRWWDSPELVGEDFAEFIDAVSRADFDR